MKLDMVFPVHCSGTALSHIPLSLAEFMIGEQLDLNLWVPSLGNVKPFPFLRSPLPAPVWKALYRLGRSDWVIRHMEKAFLKSLRPGGLAYVFPGTSIKFLREIKERGARLIIERINCHDASTKPILDKAYRLLGVDECPQITKEVIAKETETATLGDYLFSPSPLVKRTHIENNIPAERILESSYGWSPSRLQGTHKALPPCDGLTVLFVGQIGVRKGANLLLESWARSGVKGRLILAGWIEPLIAEKCAHLLNRPDVIYVGYANDIGPYFRSADVFAFPTHEEGSPLVSYEALASGLPLITTPMGAGEVAPDGQGSVVLDPYDLDAWAATFRRMAEDVEFRRNLAETGRRRAEAFTWEKVGLRRRGMIMNLA